MQLLEALRKNIEKHIIYTNNFGTEAQLKMVHAGRKRFPGPRDSIRESAVIHLVYPHNDSLYFTLIKRSTRNPNDKHSGQISLVGGAKETADKDLLETAIRECFEEIGVQIEHSDILGDLSSIYIPVSQFLVQPYLAFVNSRPNFTIQETEVDYIIEVPLEHLSKATYKNTTNISISSSVVLKDVPHYLFNGHIVWGATAMMLSELEHLINLAQS